MEFPFSNHIALLEHFLAGRQQIVQALERQLFGVKGKAMAQHGDREAIAGIFDACFFGPMGSSPPVRTATLVRSIRWSSCFARATAGTALAGREQTADLSMPRASTRCSCCASWSN